MSYPTHLEKTENDWFVVWSDLHSFLEGWHVNKTPLHPDDVKKIEKLGKNPEDFDFENKWDYELDFNQKPPKEFMSHCYARLIKKTKPRTLMFWEEFNGQKFDIGDLVWLKKSGLGFIDSSTTTGEPDLLSSIPEAWSFGGSCCVNQRSFGVNDVAHIRKNGWVYRAKDWGGEKWDKIEYICKMKKPIKEDPTIITGITVKEQTEKAKEIVKDLKNKNDGK